MSYELPTLPPLANDFTIDRPSVRKLVAEHQLILQIVATGGGNVQQASLDQQDRLLTFMSKLKEEDALQFSRLYSEELEAASAAQDVENTRMAQETAALERTIVRPHTSQFTTWIALAAFFLGLVALIKVMK